MFFNVNNNDNITIGGYIDVCVYTTLVSAELCIIVSVVVTLYLQATPQCYENTTNITPWCHSDTTFFTVKAC